MMKNIFKKKLEPNIMMGGALSEYGTNLTTLAKEGKLDPIIGRAKEVERVMQILCKLRTNNPCLVGDPGVGKTVIVEGLAHMIVNDNVPDKFKGKQVVSIEMGRLAAGASLPEVFEERLIQVVDEVKKSKGNIILFIDEVHTLIGAGAGGGSSLDAANILKPALASGELKCIGATTMNEYEKYIEKDKALARRFEIVKVPEPSVDESIEILKGLRKRYEQHHNVQYTDEAIVAAVKLSHRYISDRFLPAKAINLLDEAGSRVQLRQNQGSTSSVQFVTELHIQHIVSSWSGIPVEKVSNEESERLLNIEKTLLSRVVGQNEAVKHIARAIHRDRSGMKDPNRPTGSFLFTGPTGVGKTELAKVLAAVYLGSTESMIRLDMSEFYDKHTIAKLVGSPPGYIGSDDGGQLTEAVRRNPHTIVLFDEIEKAHKDVFDIMLQIMDDGRLTDNKGRTVDFKNTIIIMTSNIGSNVIEKAESSIGLDQVKSRVDEELKKVFKPEFLNRLDAIVIFENLKEADLIKIVDLMLTEVSDRLKDKKINLKVTYEFKKRVATEGYSTIYGARELKRTIVKLLVDNLAEKIVSKKIKEGDSIRVDINSHGEVEV